MLMVRRQKWAFHSVNYLISNYFASIQLVALQILSIILIYKLPLFRCVGVRWFPLDPTCSWIDRTSLSFLFISLEINIGIRFVFQNKAVSENISFKYIIFPCFWLSCPMYFCCCDVYDDSKNPILRLCCPPPCHRSAIKHSFLILWKSL